MAKTVLQLDKAGLLKAYRTMRTIREFEERVHMEFAKGDIPGFVHLYAGEEACAVGIITHLTDIDRIASTHRGHGHCIAKGVDVRQMMAEIYGKATGACRGKGGSMHIADLSKGMMGANGILGAGAPLICGAGLAAKYRGDGGVGITFFGDGASNQGTVLESMNLAAISRATRKPTRPRAKTISIGRRGTASRNLQRGSAKRAPSARRSSKPSTRTSSRSSKTPWLRRKPRRCRRPKS